MKRLALSLTLTGLLLVPAAAFATTGTPLTPLESTVRHKLVTLPYYSVFDDLRFQIEGDTVTLTGQVARPSLSRDAEAAVSRIAGVSQVVNNIEVLPLSNYDDWLRLRVLWAVYSQPGFQKYAGGAHPSVHVIVKNGHVTLEGTVLSELDSRLAYFGARGVGGSFSVTNNLRVDAT